MSANAVDVGDLSFTHTQMNASASWTIAHNLGKKPSVTVTDTANSQVLGDVRFLDDNSLVVTFSAPFSGSAYLN